ncbi:hypothetical protein [Streptomyces sp. H39-C1]|uniref:hypothetical protein n=1 Tax=Streptomyces sp. H39-C1 TaxID=3004355 RepID=UPI0022B03D0F|nr:hypothetical protein [Streptomyces sp. H39-C1]MCZ4099886.1 hypothetical protein [Streptomyces sp. H39-C1]
MSRDGAVAGLLIILGNVLGLVALGVSVHGQPEAAPPPVVPRCVPDLDPPAA